MAENRINNQQNLEEKRKRQLAIVKASNQMLREAKEAAMNHNSDPIRRAELEEKFEVALEQNNAFAQSYLHATLDEVENATFREADQIEVEKYNERLKKRGITDEEIHRKDSATVTIGKDGKSSIPRRRRRGAKKDLGDDYKPLDNEEELMKQSLVTDESQIQKNIEKNREIENQMIKDGNDIVKKLQKNLKEETNNKKINVEDKIDSNRVELNVKKEENQTVNETREAEVEKVVKKKKKNVEVLTYDFDFSSIPSYVQYDVIPLPSNGQCYPIDSPLRCGRVPVAYLTAADENIITSPNVYRDGKLLDIILNRKVLDKRINTNELCSGDKDAIILWLRGTSYGEEFPILATNPDTGKRYNITVNLSQFDYLPFDLEGDENGLFDYTTENGDVIKFKFFTSIDEEKLRKVIGSQITDRNKFELLKTINDLSEIVKNIEFTEEETTMIDEDIVEIKDIVGEIDETNEDVFPSVITEQMVMHTVSVNGNEDRDFIKGYIENMRTKAAMGYRNYYNDNRPGIDFNFSVNIPESDGGGSFNTFLRINDFIFINI